jgi:uncharacterized protein (DUF58 family)
MASIASEAGARVGLRDWIRSPRDALRARATARDRGEVTLGQNRVYILPTRPGLAYALLLLALLLGSMNYNLGLGFGLTFLAGSCAIVDMVFTVRNMAGLRVRPGRADAVFAGEEAPFELLAANPTRRPRYAILIDLDDVRDARHALDLEAGGGAALTVRTPSRTRGWLGAPRVRLTTSFPLGLFRAWSYWQPDSRTLVYPFPERDAPPLPLVGLPDSDGVGGGPGDDFAGVRTYQPGDPLRQLAWRRIARLDPAFGGHLVTKLFEGGARNDLVIDFDALPRTLDLELRLSRMARWVLEAEDKALPYAFRLGRIGYDAALGPAHQGACLRALALYGFADDAGGEPADNAGAQS